MCFSQALVPAVRTLYLISQSNFNKTVIHDTRVLVPPTWGDGTITQSFCYGMLALQETAGQDRQA